MNEKLEKCPFCGGQVKIDNIGDKKENIYPNRRKTPSFNYGECQRLHHMLLMAGIAMLRKMKLSRRGIGGLRNDK